MISSLTRGLLRLVFLAGILGLCEGVQPIHAMDDLTLLDASFASQVVDRNPVRVSHSYRLGLLTDGRLWFWLQVTCTGECKQKMDEKGHVDIFLDWYLEENGILKQQATLPLQVKETTWRTWAVKRVKPGSWVVVVRAEDSQWVCLKDQCDFPIKVK